MERFTWFADIQTYHQSREKWHNYLKIKQRDEFVKQKREMTIEHERKITEMGKELSANHKTVMEKIKSRHRRHVESITRQIHGLREFTNQQSEHFDKLHREVAHLRRNREQLLRKKVQEEERMSQLEAEIEDCKHNLSQSRWETKNNAIRLEMAFRDDFANLEINEMTEIELQNIALSDSLNVTRENYERTLNMARWHRTNQEHRLENRAKQDISNWIASERSDMCELVKKNRTEIRELEENLKRVRKETIDFRDANPSNSVLLTSLRSRLMRKKSSIVAEYRDEEAIVRDELKDHTKCRKRFEKEHAELKSEKKSLQRKIKSLETEYKQVDANRSQNEIDYDNEEREFRRNAASENFRLRRELKDENEREKFEIRKQLLREEQIVAIRSCEVEDMSIRVDEMKKQSDIARRSLSHLWHDTFKDYENISRASDRKDCIAEQDESYYVPSQLAVLSWLKDIAKLSESEARSFVEMTRCTTLKDMSCVNEKTLRFAQMRAVSSSSSFHDTLFNTTDQEEEEIQHESSVSLTLRTILREMCERSESTRLRAKKIFSRLESECPRDTKVLERRNSLLELREHVVRMKREHITFRKNRDMLLRHFKSQLMNSLDNLARGLIRSENDHEDVISDLLELYARTCEARKDHENLIWQPRDDTFEISRLTAHLADSISDIDAKSCVVTGMNTFRTGDSNVNTFRVHLRNSDDSTAVLSSPNRVLKGLNSNVIARLVVGVSFVCMDRDDLHRIYDVRTNEKGDIECRYSVPLGVEWIKINVDVLGVPLTGSPFALALEGK